MSVSLQDAMAGIYWKDARVLQGIEVEVDLRRGGTRAALGALAVVVLPLLPSSLVCGTKPQSIENMASPCLCTSHEGGNSPCALGGPAQRQPDGNQAPYPP